MVMRKRRKEYMLHMDAVEKDGYDILERAGRKQARAYELIGYLDLLNRWNRVGSPVVVGAVRYGLVAARDIDMEVYSDAPRIWDGFSVMSGVAVMPGVREVTFMNGLDSPDMGLYWRVIVRDADGGEWKIDTWHVGHDHPDAHWCERFAVAMEASLTDDVRRAIIGIKESLVGEGVRGIDVYRAVMEGGVTGIDEFRKWYDAHQPDGMCHWLPSGNGCMR